MGNLHLVTGHAGKAHVTAADHASLHAAIMGEGQYVLNRGSKFAYTIVTNNTIRIADGDILMQGRHIRLNEGAYVDLTIENGAQGYYRNDLIVARYTKDSTSGVEDCNLVVIKGTGVASNPVDPAYTNADIINDHVLIADMPLYRVPLDGLNVQELEPLFVEASINIVDKSITSVKLANKAVTPEKLDRAYATLDGNDKVTAAQASAKIKTTSATTYPLVAEDAGKFIQFQSSCTAIIPTDEECGIFPIGTEIELYKVSSANTLSVEFDSSDCSFRTTDAAPTSITADGSYAVIVLKRIGVTVWLAKGDIA